MFNPEMCSLLGCEVRNCIQTSSTHVLSTQDSVQQIRFAALVQELKGKRFKPVPGLSTNLRPIARLGSNTLPREIEPLKKKEIPIRVTSRFIFWLYRHYQPSEIGACEGAVGTALLLETDPPGKSKDCGQKICGHPIHD
ncbi:hypothetical protein B0H13DRAFT_1870266 [Mycena leptocephala]|nr:hypothetical protein B0H13DRAFT_1870266 [Mycena leptocephala]